MRFFHLFFLLAITTFSCKQAKHPDIKYFPIDGNAWQIELLTDTTREVKSLVFSTYDGRIVNFDHKNEQKLWEFDAGAFIYQLKTKDIDLDGNQEIFAVSANNKLIVLDHQGQLIWSYSDTTPLFAVDAGNIDPGSPGLEIAAGGISRKVFIFNNQGNLIGMKPDIDRLVFRLTVNNLDDDDADEILVIENRVIAQAIKYNYDQVETLWRKPLRVPEEYINWENPRGNFYPFSLISSDLDGDGTMEIIGGDTYFNKQAVGVFDHEVEPLWLSDKQPAFENRENTQTEFYSTAFVRTGDLFPEITGSEIMAVAGGNFRIFSQSGELLGEQGAPIGFTDFEISGNEVYLASSPNGDNNLYRILIDMEWKETVKKLERRGKMARIGSNLDILLEQVDGYKETRPRKKDYYIKSKRIETTEEGLQEYRQFNEWFSKRFPYANLKQLVSVKVIEPVPPLDERGEPWSEWRWSVDAINGTMTVEEILAKAKWIEENKIPALFVIGHSCMPFITLETAERILQTAPNYCVGFQSMEDEDLDRIPRYFEHYFGPLADLCVEYGYKIAMTKNKGLWWMSTPALKESYEGLFSGERKKVVMAATEDSNSRTPEINLLGRSGLWQAGLLPHNDVSIHADLFSFNRFFQWEYPKTGSPYLRLMTAHTTLGMSLLSTRINEIYEREGHYRINRTGEESTGIFYHMLGKGLVFSPEPDEVLGYNPIGFVVHRPPEKWLTDAHNGHAPEKWEEDEELHQAVMPHNGCLWGITPTPDHAIQSVLMDKKRQFGYQIPPTPYGLIAFVPEQAELDNVQQIDEWWHTDGIYVWKEGGEKLTGNQAAEALKIDFERGAERLPFRVKGYAFLNTLKLSDGHYRLYLIDPGWLDPAEREVTVMIQVDGNFKAEDILSNENMNIDNNRIDATIPAGSLRIIDVTPR